MRFEVENSPNAWHQILLMQGNGGILKKKKKKNNFYINFCRSQPLGYKPSEARIPSCFGSLLLLSGDSVIKVTTEMASFGLFT